MTAREKAIQAHRALLNGGKLSYFKERGISAETVRAAWVGYDAVSGAFTYPCIAKAGGLLGIHYKSAERNEKGKRQQWWGGFAENLPLKRHGKKPADPAKIIPFGLETLRDLKPGSLIVLCCGEEDALSVRQAGYVALSQPGAGLLEPAYAGEFEGLEVVAAGMTTNGGGADSHYEATIYPGPKGNTVFNASTIFWAQGLSSPPGHWLPYVHNGRPHGPDKRVQTIAANLLAKWCG